MSAWYDYFLLEYYNSKPQSDCHALASVNTLKTNGHSFQGFCRRRKSLDLRNCDGCPWCLSGDLSPKFVMDMPVEHYSVWYNLRV